jgi:hypothetical protein
VSTDTSACPPYRVIISNDRQDILDTTWNYSDVLDAGDRGRPLPNGWRVKKIPF